jgi:3-hydroxyisobutyrate dehydrogenase-like beta-hydroxyacid dehydrogenase
MLGHGYGLIAYDTNPLMADRIVDHGAVRAHSIREVVDTAEIVFACLPNPEVSLGVALGVGGVCEGTRVKYYVENSTVGAATMIEIDKGLSDNGISLLDVPVTGAVMAAEAGGLGVLVAGPLSTFDIVRPMLDTFAGKILNFGPVPGQAQIAKLLSNALAFSNLFSAFEGLAIGLKAGIDRNMLVDLFNAGSAANFATQKVLPNYILPGRLEGTGVIENVTKDLRLYLEEVRRMGGDSPIGQNVARLGEEILSHGPSGRDTMTAFLYFCALAGVEFKP